MHVIDILPTIAFMVGLSIVPEMHIDGLNIWKTTSENESMAERTLYWRTPSQIALRQGDWKLVHIGDTLDQGINELYNLAVDPNEIQDIAEDYPEILSALLRGIGKQVELDGRIG